MSIFQKIRGKVLPEDNFLRYIPERKHVDYEIRNDRVLLRFHHDRPAERFARWLVKKPDRSDLELDDLGSCVWLAMDGRRSVHDLATLLERQFGNRADQAQGRLVVFLRYLNKKGWITFKRGAQ
jgi:hypothetical protein